MSLADLCEKPIEVQPAVESVVKWIFYMLIIDFLIRFLFCHKAVLVKTFGQCNNFFLKKYCLYITSKHSFKRNLR